MKCEYCDQRTMAKTICTDCEIIVNNLEKFLKNNEKSQLFVLQKYLEATKPGLVLKNPQKNQWWGIYRKSDGKLLHLEFFEDKPKCIGNSNFDDDGFDDEEGFNLDRFQVSIEEINDKTCEIKRVIIQRDEV